MRCVICGERITAADERHGNVAEMHDPEQPEEGGGIVHAECGLARGWAVS